MTFRRDCRYLGGIAEIEPVRRICAIKSDPITSCDGCQEYVHRSKPCDECGIVAACKNRDVAWRPPGLPVKYDSVSVIIPCHNYGRFLTEAIESVLSQTVKPVEIIVVDDASTDETNEVTKWIIDNGQLIMKESEPAPSSSLSTVHSPLSINSGSSTPIEYLRVEHQSVYRARKSGLAKAVGDFVVFLDADDKLAPTFIQECLAAFERLESSDEKVESRDVKTSSDKSVDSQLSENYSPAASPRLAICTTDLQQFGMEDSVLAQQITDINQTNWIHAGSMVRRSALIASAAYEYDDIALEVCEDWFVWRHVINAGFKATKVSKPLYHYRRHESSRSRTHWHQKNYYNSAGLMYEPITFASGDQINEEALAKSEFEYIFIRDDGTTFDDPHELLKQMYFDVAGVSGTRAVLVRRSVIREGKLRFSDGKPYLAGSYRWVPEHAVERRLEAVLITPLLTVGGAEQWIRMLVTLADPAVIHWRIVLLNSSRVSPFTVDPIKAVAEMFVVGEGYPDARAAIKAAAAGADVILTWGGEQHWPIDVGLPVIMSAHGCCEYTRKLLAVAKTGGATHFCCVSERSKETTTTPEMKASVIWNGADVSRLKVRKTRDEIRAAIRRESSGEKVENRQKKTSQISSVYSPLSQNYSLAAVRLVGCIGRIATEKNPLSIVSAVWQLPWNYKCVLIGDGPKEIIDHARRILGERLYHVPSVDDVGNYFNAIDVFAQCSPSEGNSVSIIEAMLCGVPIVTTRVGAIDEFEVAANRKLFYSVPKTPASHEIAVAIREAIEAGREADRVKSSQEFANNFLTGKRMADDWTAYLKRIAREPITNGCDQIAAAQCHHQQN